MPQMAESRESGSGGRNAILARPWLTVITPVYKGESFIERCLRNVAEQECPGVEHLIIDGGSLDGTVSVIERLAREVPRLRWVSERDLGQSDAMNRGVALAQGDVIGVLNVDDRYEPGTLNRVREVFEGSPEPTFAVGNCNVLDDSGRLLWVNRPRRPYFIDMLVRDSHAPNCPVNPSAYFYHRSLHDRIGWYDAADHLTMDVDFVLRAVQQAHVVYIDETWGSFWLHSETKTAKDIRAGTAAARFAAITSRFRSRLGLRDRVLVEARSAVTFLMKPATRLVRRSCFH